MSGILSDPALVTLEFDVRTHELYGFAYWPCLILCPPTPVVPVRIDPFTGSSEWTGWPTFPGFQAGLEDFDIDPVSRDLRFFGYPASNFRFSLEDLQFTEDVAFDEPGNYYALAHTPPAEPGGGVETFAIVRHPTNELRLARIGGPGGSPPASSGEVTWIGPITVEGEVAGFDISQGGTAYLSIDTWTDFGFGEVYTNRLYTIDLATGSTQDLGVIGVTGPDSLITGIAVAPEGLGPGILEIPSLSPVGIGFLATALACASLVYLSANRRFGQSVGEGRRR